MCSSSTSAHDNARLRYFFRCHNESHAVLILYLMNPLVCVFVIKHARLGLRLLA